MKFLRIFCQRRKMQYFANLNEKNITDNRNFWQTVKPFLSSGKKFKRKYLLKLKDKESLDGFQREIRKLKPFEYPCRICRTIVPNLDFI